MSFLMISHFGLLPQEQIDSAKEYDLDDQESFSGEPVKMKAESLQATSGRSIWKTIVGFTNSLASSGLEK